MNILIIGDIVGKPGRKTTKDFLDKIESEEQIDLIIANGENAAGGNGITQQVADELFSYGIDAITMGNHVWDNREIFDFIDNEPRIIRPANYPLGTPGNYIYLVEIKSKIVAIMNLLGNVFMNNLYCPFMIAEKQIENLRNKADIIIIDFHAEATAEKIALARMLDGDVSILFGTHTHVQTSDERIFPKGTAYITDVGMTGPYDSVLGVDMDIIIKKFKTKLPARYKIAKGACQVNAIIVNIDDDTSKPQSIKRILKIYE
ncbi:MAG: TIGR00282 family metallophosphoesterase [Clostridia bacterium]|nr:TIGR00282 family metallophosphoesterase [Clostridia bacterium]